ncbi:hypothetical protein C1M51_02725 [Methylibium sp. Pch-M]|uniref:hypothetical protein n=1 Tax=Methylibium sp. Pch-M TaxID=2082386 RepID=UPI0010113856|nr:hypothetical protein [Methylibium sp. Pch-M]QAZ38419.1 hypothetical protein C1M51_02725 [Methylibium sp. Pch-M]
MIRFILSLMPWWVWALILAGLGACAGIAVWRTATTVERAKWQAATLDAREQARLEEKARSQRAASAAAEFERWRRQQDRRLTEASNALSIALRTPISCPATLAEVVVPAAAVDELRRAGDDAPGHDAPPAELVR